MRSADSCAQPSGERGGLTRTGQEACHTRLIPKVAGLAVLLAFCASGAEMPYFSVLSEDPGAWPRILSSIGLQPKPAGLAHIFVARTGASASAEWPMRVDRGAVLILEGES